MEKTLIKSDIGQMFKIQEKENGEIAISARELHKALNIKTRFSQWVKDNEDVINNKCIEEITTFTIVNNGAKRSLKDYLFPKEIALAVVNKCRTSNEDNNVKVYRFLLELFQLDKKIYYLQGKRKEQKLAEMLHTLTDLTWQEQYSVGGGKYFIDFYSKSGLIVEYDERYHKYQQEKDNKRMMEILNLLAEENLEEDGERFKPAVIRIKEGEELIGLKKVIDYIKANDMGPLITVEPDVDYKADFPDREQTQNINIIGAS